MTARRLAALARASTPGLAGRAPESAVGSGLEKSPALPRTGRRNFRSALASIWRIGPAPPRSACRCPRGSAESQRWRGRRGAGAPPGSRLWLPEQNELRSAATSHPRHECPTGEDRIRSIAGVKSMESSRFRGVTRTQPWHSQCSTYFHASSLRGDGSPPQPKWPPSGTCARSAVKRKTPDGARTRSGT